MATTHRSVLGIAMLMAVAGVTVSAAGQSPIRIDPLPAIAPNDNRAPGGVVIEGAVELHLLANLGAWRPDLDVDSAVTVPAFSDGAGGAPRIPGPLLRASRGTEIHLKVTNQLPDSMLVVYGLRAGAVPASDDTIQVARGDTRELRFRVNDPGTYLYWGSTTGTTDIAERTARDSQLTGAIVVDPAGTPPDQAERIFVMTVIDIIPDETLPPPLEDIWELAVNGLSWPHTERLAYAVGETVRWRWLNGSYLPHPMHLHGFHFRVTAKGDGTTDVTYHADSQREVVTEFMSPGSTFAMEWTPTREGNWIFHCHMAPHIVPFPPRVVSEREHEGGDALMHATHGMAGLVLGITTTGGEGGGPPVSVDPSRRMRLIAHQAPPTERPDIRATGYSLGDPTPASPTTPGPPIVLTRGETTVVTVVNRTDEATTVHWHGIELESYFDGVAGWSGLGSSVAPLIAPGDSFTVSFTPPRAGTFIYHSHVDESMQLLTGAYGPLLVMEPGEVFDPATDLVFVAARAVDSGVNGPALNGLHAPPPLDLRVGTTYRLRFINIFPAEPLFVEIDVDAAAGVWRPISKDGAALPASLQGEQTARAAPVGVGETHDFLWTTPDRPGDAVLRVGESGSFAVEQILRVR